MIMVPTLTQEVHFFFLLSGQGLFAGADQLR